MMGIKSCILHFGCSPQKIIIPYTTVQIDTLCALLDDWAILRCSFVREFGNHYPKDPLLQFFTEHPVIFPRVTAFEPLLGALDIYTDGSKTGVGAYLVDSQQPVSIQYIPGTPQITECKIVLEVFKRFQEAFNLISDSAYVVNAVRSLEITGPIKNSNAVSNVLSELQKLIWNRKNEFYVQRIRAHTMLPGPMASDNASTRQGFIFHASPIDVATKFHQQFHVPAHTLQLKFHIPRAAA